MTPPDDGPELLYHYTTAVGLEGILTTGDLWATNALYLNDATEITHFLNLLRQEVDVFLRGHLSPREIEIAGRIRETIDVTSILVSGAVQFLHCKLLRR